MILLIWTSDINLDLSNNFVTTAYEFRNPLYSTTKTLGTSLNASVGKISKSVFPRILSETENIESFYSR